MNFYTPHKVNSDSNNSGKIYEYTDSISLERTNK